MRILHSTAAAAAILGAAPVAGQFYAGDPDRVRAMSCERSTQVVEARVFEQATFSATFVTSQLVGHFAQSPTAGTVSLAYWEVRTGMTHGNPGLLIAQGFTPANTTHYGWMNGSYPFQPQLGAATMPSVKIVRIDTSIPPLALPPGTYQFTLCPVGNGVGRFYACSTSGANGIGGPLNDGVAWLESTFWGYSGIDSQSAFGVGVDFSLGLQ